jgi:hypothetical protein
MNRSSRPSDDINNNVAAQSTRIFENEVEKVLAMKEVVDQITRQKKCSVY